MFRIKIMKFLDANLQMNFNWGILYGIINQELCWRLAMNIGVIGVNHNSASNQCKRKSFIYRYKKDRGDKLLTR